MGEGIRGHKQEYISPSAPLPRWCSPLNPLRLQSALRAQFAGNVSQCDWFEMGDSLTSCLYKARQLLGEIKFLQEQESHIFSICLTESFPFAIRVNKKKTAKMWQEVSETLILKQLQHKPLSFQNPAWKSFPLSRAFQKQDMTRQQLIFANNFKTYTTHDAQQRIYPVIHLFLWKIPL